MQSTHKTSAINPVIFPNNLNEYTIKKQFNGVTCSTYLLKAADKDKPDLVLKFGAHEDQIKLEILSNRVYQALGVPVPQMAVYREIPQHIAEEINQPCNRIYKVTEYIGNNLVGANIDENKIKESIAKHFVIHALLGNIDVGRPDQYVLDENNNILLVDAGVSFICKASGDRHDQNPNAVFELEYFLDQNKNSDKDFSGLFSYLPHEKIIEQAKEIIKNVRIIEETIWHVTADLGFKTELHEAVLSLFAERLDSIARKYGLLDCIAPRSDQAMNLSYQMAAGAFAYAEINGMMSVLLAKRKGPDEWWDVLGGKGAESDTNLRESAIREVAEESAQQIKLSEYELINAPFHDLVTDENHNYYRMYFVQRDASSIDINKLKDHEHTDYQWVPIKDLFTSQKEIIVEGKKTVKINGNIILFPSFYKILQQESVKNNLNRLISGDKILPTHTRGYSDKPEQARTTQAMVTPDAMREQISVQLIKKSNVLRQIKSNNEKAEKLNNDLVNQSQRAPSSTMSPSENTASRRPLDLKQLLLECLGDFGVSAKEITNEGAEMNDRVYSTLLDQKKSLFAINRTEHKILSINDRFKRAVYAQNLSLVLKIIDANPTIKNQSFSPFDDFRSQNDSLPLLEFILKNMDLKKCIAPSNKKIWDLFIKIFSGQDGFIKTAKKLGYVLTHLSEQQQSAVMEAISEQNKLYGTNGFIKTTEDLRDLLDDLPDTSFSTVIEAITKENPNLISELIPNMSTLALCAAGIADTKLSILIQAIPIEILTNPDEFTKHTEEMWLLFPILSEKQNRLFLMKNKERFAQVPNNLIQGISALCRFFENQTDNQCKMVIETIKHKLIGHNGLINSIDDIQISCDDMDTTKFSMLIEAIKDDNQFAGPNGLINTIEKLQTALSYASVKKTSILINAIPQEILVGLIKTNDDLEFIAPHLPAEKRKEIEQTLLSYQTRQELSFFTKPANPLVETIDNESTTFLTMDGIDRLEM